jgi:hypothetical protein
MSHESLRFSRKGITRSEERSLLVKGLAVVVDKGGRDEDSISTKEYR